MRVEFIGCTGAGKSTLVAQVQALCAAQGSAATTGYGLALRQLRLGWLRGRVARGLVINLLAIGVGMLGWRRNRTLLRLAFRTLARLPRSVGWFERLYISRDVVKNLGVDAIARRRAGGRLVLLDEGPLHTAHYLFVHSSAAPDAAALAEFAALAPLPDLLVYVRQPEALLVERTLARGHRRIPPGSRAAAEQFVGRAVQVFERLIQEPRIAERLLVLGPAIGDSQAAALVCAAIEQAAPPARRT